MITASMNSSSFSFNFQHYLDAKRSVDDRALNRQVWAMLAQHLAQVSRRPIRILEIGAGIGTMIPRVWEWGLVDQATYLALDIEMANLQYARRWLAHWARQAGITFDATAGSYLFQQGERWLRLDLLAADAVVPGGLPLHLPQFDLLIAHAVLDLVNLEAGLTTLSTCVRSGGWLYLTLNFDGLSLFLPPLSQELDEQVIALYHQSMDERRLHGLPTGGSTAGRALFTTSRTLGLEVLTAGASDWVVFPHHGRYPAQEAYFLECILHFVEESLTRQALLPADLLKRWLTTRREQIARGELIFVAHQLDFLLRVP